ncbi:MAG: hypothetical protein LBR08_01630, partial [Bacteroidales bacterium]|nr:hypothetical protein [Bacteroidales bacterium]
MYPNIRSYCTIRRHHAQKDGKTLFEAPGATESADFLTALYRELKLDYRKFFKMDNLSRLGFLASEILLAGQIDREKANEDVSVILFNRSSSLDVDTACRRSMDSSDNGCPSPSIFIYTLPNIVAGEIAIRNGIFGETAFFIGERFNGEELCRRVTDAFDDDAQKSLCGWVEYD